MILAIMITVAFARIVFINYFINFLPIIHLTASTKKLRWMLYLAEYSGVLRPLTHIKIELFEKRF